MTNTIHCRECKRKDVPLESFFRRGHAFWVCMDCIDEANHNNSLARKGRMK